MGLSLPWNYQNALTRAENPPLADFQYCSAKPRANRGERPYSGGGKPPRSSSFWSVITRKYTRRPGLFGALMYTTA